MTFTITAAAPAAPIAHHELSDDSSLDSEGDTDMAPAPKRPRLSPKSTVTPGETVTDDPQWMRCSISKSTFPYPSC